MAHYVAYLHLGVDVRRIVVSIEARYGSSVVPHPSGRHVSFAAAPSDVERIAGILGVTHIHCDAESALDDCFAA